MEFLVWEMADPFFIIVLSRGKKQPFSILQTVSGTKKIAMGRMHCLIYCTYLWKRAEAGALAVL